MATTAKASIPRSSEESSKIVNTTGWITVNQVVDLLGVSRSSVYAWERSGLIHPQRVMRDAHGTRMLVVYDPDELTRIPRRHRQSPGHEAGELAARVFEMLNDGCSIREIVIRARETVPKIVELREAWLDAGGADSVISSIAKRELERFVGTFSTVAELVTRVTAALGHLIADVNVPEEVTDREIEQAINAVLDTAGDGDGDGDDNTTRASNGAQTTEVVVAKLLEMATVATQTEACTEASESLAVDPGAP